MDSVQAKQVCNPRAREDDPRALLVGAYTGLEGLIEIMEQHNGNAVVHLDSMIALLRPLAEQLGHAMDKLGD